MKVLEALQEAWEELESYIEVTGAGEILRRYFAMNAFDGALTMLGFIMGAYVSGLKNAHIVLAAGLSMSLAMGVSGFVGAFITEKAEREKKVKELERVLFASLSGTVIDRAAKFAVITAALVDATAPAFAALISASPFVLTLLGLVSFDLAVLLSVVVTLAFLFLLGAYLGRIAQSNPFTYGLYMLLAGAITSALIGIIGGW